MANIREHASKMLANNTQRRKRAVIFVILSVVVGLLTANGLQQRASTLTSASADRDETSSFTGAASSGAVVGEVVSGQGSSYVGEVSGGEAEIGGDSGYAETPVTLGGEVVDLQDQDAGEGQDALGGDEGPDEEREAEQPAEEQKAEESEAKDSADELKAEDSAESPSQKQLSAKAGEGKDATVRVDAPAEAKLPDGAKLRVVEVDPESKTYEAYKEQALKALGTDDRVVLARFFDISIVKDGEDVQPEESVQVSIKLPDAPSGAMDAQASVVHFEDEKQNVAEPAGEGKSDVEDAIEADDSKPEDKDAIEADETGAVVDDDTQVEAVAKQVPEVIRASENGGTTSFDAQHFSVYGVVYTVDFQWDVDGRTFEFSLPGGGFVSFASLVEELGLQSQSDVLADDATGEFLADVDKVEFSAPDLLSVSKVEEDTTVGEIKKRLKLVCEYSSELTQEQIDEIDAQKVEAGDWAIISIKPFSSEETLTVAMKTDEVFSVKVTDVASTNPANTKISRNDIEMVNTREDGIIIKLFDYSGKDSNGNDIDSKWGANYTSDQLRAGWGVNNGRTLVFSGSGMGGVEWYNNFTGTRTDDNNQFYSGKRKSEIVKDELVNGFPQLSDTIQLYGSDDGSLDYLFSSGKQEGVTEYSANGQGLLGLLRKNSDGYYYYSSEDNYARFDGNEYIDLYTDTYFKDKGQEAFQDGGFGSIGFFPYTNYDPTHKEEKGPNEMYYDHQHGMSIQAHFVYPPNGKLNDGQGDPMVFEFSGDDDVWVYVDGKLALDLGGVHQPIKGVIDFANKEVRVYEYEAYSTTSPKQEIVTTISFDDIFGEDGFDDSSYSTHKLDFFFLERGGCDSNCALSFNLLTLATAEKQFTKVDGSIGLPGAAFTVYTDEDCTEPVSVANQPLTATSDDNGRVYFPVIPVRKDANDTPLVYYMKETSSPFGYQQNKAAYKLVYNANAKTYDILTLDNVSSEEIVNNPLEPIELGIEKKWQDAAGNEITPANDYSATFEVHRLRSYKAPDEIVTGTEDTLRIRRVANDDGWGTSAEQIYKYLRSRTVTISYDYHGTYSNNKRQYRYTTNNGSNWTYSSDSLPETGSFDIQIPSSGQLLIEFYDTNGVVTWGIDDGAQQGEMIYDEPDNSFTNTLTLSGGVTSGKFDSQLYAGTDDAGKFPLTETIDGITYVYKYYIVETAKSPSNSETIYVDKEGNVIADPSMHAIDEDADQTVINRSYLDIPIEKTWYFGTDASSIGDSWTATMQLLWRFVNEQGEGVTSFKPVDGKRLEISSENAGRGEFEALPMYGIQDNVEYRIQYSVAEIAYTVKDANNAVVVQWQDPNYYENPVNVGTTKYSLHYIQDAGENGDDIEDYSIIINNTPENLKQTKTIDVKLRKTWPSGVDLSNASASFVLKRYVYEEYRNFPENTTEWVDITLDTGNGATQKMHVPKNWGMTIYCHIKANTNAEQIEFSDIDAVSYDNSSESSDYLLAIPFVADQTKTVILQGGARYVVGGVNGFRLSDVNDPNDKEEKLDQGYMQSITLSNSNGWRATIRKLPAIEEDAQYEVENPLEITRRVYRYFIEEVSCSPEDYEATFTDGDGNLLGDANHMVDYNASVVAENHLKRGSLKITKSVKVDNADPSSVHTALVDGEYKFTIKGVENTSTADEEERVATLTISNGQPNTVEVEDLLPGQYVITEQTPQNGTSLIGNNGLTVTVLPGKTGDSVPTDGMASFVNNIDTTNIQFAKEWKEEDRVTPLSGKEDETVMYTLMQRAMDAEGNIVRNGVYAGMYFKDNQWFTSTTNAPCYIYVTKNAPVTIQCLPKSGMIEEERVSFYYYAVEAEEQGFVADMPHPITEGTFTISNDEISETSCTTDIAVEKEWTGANAGTFGGVMLQMIQEKSVLPNDKAKEFYPVVIRLQDGNGSFSQADRFVYVKRNTSLAIPVQKLSDGSGYAYLGSSYKEDGQSFETNMITESRVITLGLDDNNVWGTHWEVGTIEATNAGAGGMVSDTPKTFIDELGTSDDLEYVSTGETATIKMTSAGTATLVDGTYEIKAYPNQWKAIVEGLPYFEQGEDGRYYAYRYRVVETSIIDSDTGEEIEAIVQNTDGTGGESTHYIVTYNNGTDSSGSDSLKVTNAKRPEVEITLKKVDKANLNKDNPEASDLLDGAKFKIFKYKKLSPLEYDAGWNDAHSVESSGVDGVFTFTSLSAGIYAIEETEYPPGYVNMIEKPYIRVNEDLSIQLVDSEGNTIGGNATELMRVVDNEAIIIVGNVPGVALPNTGGCGPHIITAVGAMLTVTAGAGFMAMRKKKCL